MSDEVSVPSKRKRVIVLLSVVVLVLTAAYFAGRPIYERYFQTSEAEPANMQPTDTAAPTSSETEVVAEPTPAEEPTEATSDLRRQADEYIAEVTAYNEQELPKPSPSADDLPLVHAHEHTPPEVILDGEEWFGHVGVNVCAPSDQDSCGGEMSVGAVPTNRWQSVELVQRHYTAMEWYDGVFEGVEGAVDIYTLAESLGMESQPFNDVQQIASGDIIVHNSAGYDSSDEGYGRASIVNFHEGNVIHAVEQNGNPNARAVYIVIDNTLVRVDAVDGELVSTVNTVKGVVHSPNNTNNEPHAMREGYDEEEFSAYLDLVKEVAEQ